MHAQQFSLRGSSSNRSKPDYVPVSKILQMLVSYQVTEEWWLWFCLCVMRLTLIEVLGHNHHYACVKSGKLRG
jgi:N-glycosylase/DNA lyase